MDSKTNDMLLDYVKKTLTIHKLIPLFCAVYGSHVYGTANLLSDFDIFVVVDNADHSKDHPKDHPNVTPGNKNQSISLDLHQTCDPKIPESMIDLTIRSMDLFDKEISEGLPRAIEILLTPDRYILIGNDRIKQLKESMKFSACPKLKHAIRCGFSKMASLAEVRARKKFKDGEIHHALKSQFHSYRILMYGIQLGTQGMIVDWAVANDYLKELMSVDHSTLSDKFFRDSYKLRVKSPADNEESVMTRFKLALPELTDK